MLYELVPTDMRSSCRASKDLPANLPALFTSIPWPCTSCPAGITTSPSADTGASRVALKVCPACAVSESSSSTRRMASVVPDGMVTLFGAGGGAGAAAGTGVCCAGAGSEFCGGAIAGSALESAMEDSRGADRRMGLERSRGTLGLGLTGALSGSAGVRSDSWSAWLVIAIDGADPTCRLLTTCLTPGTIEA